MNKILSEKEVTSLWISKMPCLLSTKVIRECKKYDQPLILNRIFEKLQENHKVLPSMQNAKKINDKMVKVYLITK